MALKQKCHNIFSSFSWCPKSPLYFKRLMNQHNALTRFKPMFHSLLRLFLNHANHLKYFLKDRFPCLPPRNSDFECLTKYPKRFFDHTSWKTLP